MVPWGIIYNINNNKKNHIDLLERNMTMRFTVLRAVRSKDMDVDLDHKTDVDNVERDSPDYVTVYGTEKDGQLYYIVLDQELIDRLKTI